MGHHCIDFEQRGAHTASWMICAGSFSSRTGVWHFIILLPLVGTHPEAAPKGDGIGKPGWVHAGGGRAAHAGGGRAPETPPNL